VNFTAHLEEQFSWLLTMARNPGFKAQAWHRAQELAASDPMYRDFPERLTLAMTVPAESSPPSSGSGSTSRTRPA
jgi:hypothetical protein